MAKLGHEQSSEPEGFRGPKNTQMKAEHSSWDMSSQVCRAPPPPRSIRQSLTRIWAYLSLLKPSSFRDCSRLRFLTNLHWDKIMLLFSRQGLWAADQLSWPWPCDLFDAKGDLSTRAFGAFRERQWRWRGHNRELEGHHHTPGAGGGQEENEEKHRHAKVRKTNNGKELDVQQLKSIL